MEAVSITSFVMNLLQALVLLAGAFVFKLIHAEMRKLDERITKMEDTIKSIQVDQAELSVRLQAIDEKLVNIKGDTRDLKNAIFRLLNHMTIAQTEKLV